MKENTQTSQTNPRPLKKRRGDSRQKNEARRAGREKEEKGDARRPPRAEKGGGTRRVREDLRDVGTRSRPGGAAHVTTKPTRAPALSPRLWYGMPAYAKDGKVVCFFQGAYKFKSRYATFGFDEAANLDDGAMWPTSFALTELTAADEARIGALVKRAVS